MSSAGRARLRPRPHKLEGLVCLAIEDPDEHNEALAHLVSRRHHHLSKMQYLQPRLARDYMGASVKTRAIDLLSLPPVPPNVQLLDTLIQNTDLDDNVVLEVDRSWASQRDDVRFEDHLPGIHVYAMACGASNHQLFHDELLSPSTLASLQDVFEQSDWDLTDPKDLNCLKLQLEGWLVNAGASTSTLAETIAPLDGGCSFGFAFQLNQHLLCSMSPAKLDLKQLKIAGAMVVQGPERISTATKAAYKANTIQQTIMTLHYRDIRKATKWKPDTKQDAVHNSNNKHVTTPQLLKGLPSLSALPAPLAKILQSRPITSSAGPGFGHFFYKADPPLVKSTLTLHVTHAILGMADAEVALAAALEMAAAPAKTANNLEGFAAANAVKSFAPDMALEPVHMHVAADFDFANAALDGAVTHTVCCNVVPAAALADVTSRLTLHAVGFDNVRVTGEGVAGFDYDGKEIHVRWTAPFAAKGEERKITVTYRVETPVAGMHFNGPRHGDPSHGTFAVTDHETERARYWLPCVDLPAVRPRLSFALTVPEAYHAVANGDLVSESVADGRKTVNWALDFPCPSYLLCVAAGDFVTIDNRPAKLANGAIIPIKYYGTQKMPAADLFRGLDRTPEILEWLSAKLDFPLPWGKYYQVATPYSGGAMENISFVTWTDIAALDKIHARDRKFAIDGTDIHEAVHTWFGDVTVMRHFEHAWLKESWATYIPLVFQAEGYYAGRTDPPATFGCDHSRYNLFMCQERYIAETARYLRPIVCRRFDHSWSMFDGHLYPGGAARIHMLRGLLGDAIFWPAVSAYLHRYSGKTVETDDFRKVMEEFSGLNLTRFFDQWFYSKGYPKFKATYAFDADKHVAHVTLVQTQADAAKGIPLFAMDVPIEFTTEDGTVHRAIASFDGNNAKAIAAVHTGASSTKPARVEIDPNGFQLFAFDGQFNPGQPILLNVAKHSADVATRIRAFRTLLKDADLTTLRKVRAVALAEPSPWVRQEIVGAIKGYRHTPFVQLALDLIDAETNDMARTAMLGHVHLTHTLTLEFARAKLAAIADRSLDWTYLQAGALLRILATHARAKDFAFVADAALGKGLVAKFEYYHLVQADA
ncbi:hypothetical protein H9P43_003220 [Blastocladiella emersonii ATCC 22665]|nr:hypothetical protein H9P43_003220 [Blastocladiella emersonii ATCC 22665]